MKESTFLHLFWRKDELFQVNRPESMTTGIDDIIVLGAELLKFLLCITILGGEAFLLFRPGGGASKTSSEGVELVENPGVRSQDLAGSEEGLLRQRRAGNESLAAKKGDQGADGALLSTDQGAPVNGRAAFKRKMRSLLSGREFLAMAVPALIYLVQNKLIFVSFGMLPGPMFQVVYQMKIMSAALLSKIFLGKVFSTQKWICLLILTVGVCIVQVDGTNFAKILIFRKNLYGLVCG